MNLIPTCPPWLSPSSPTESSDPPETCSPSSTSRTFSNPLASSFPSSTSSSLSAVPCHAIPEILQEIFSYLSQYDLFQRTSRVNRFWRSTSLHLVRGEVTWQDTMSQHDQESVFQRVGLESTKILRLWAQDARVFAHYEAGIEQQIHDAWEAMARTIELLTGKVRGGHNDDIDRRCDLGAIINSSLTRSVPRWQTLIFCGETRRLQLHFDPWIHHGFFASVSTVHLLHLTPGVIDLSCILGGLPNLTELAIESMEGRPFASRRNVVISWESQGARAAASVDRPGIIAEEGGPLRDREIDEGWTMVLPKLRIRTLSLRAILVNQVILEALLGSMPHLRSLELQSLIQPDDSHYVDAYGGRRAVGGAIGEAEPFDPYSYMNRKHLLQFLIKHCPRLSHFHLSIYASWWKLSHDDMVQVANAFPDLRSFSFLTTDLQLLTLPLFVDRLTSLEVVANGQTNMVRTCLHWYLCHAPFLLHIKMSDVRFFTNDFILDPTSTRSGAVQDAGTEVSAGTSTSAEGATATSTTTATATTAGNGRIQSIPTRTVPPVETWNFQGRVWACRNLRTIELSIEMEQPVYYAGRRQSATMAGYDYANNRRLFAYLSLVCPKLEEISVQGHQLDLSIQSGFILLSRLERLRRLRFFVSKTPWFEKEGLEWMRVGWKIWPPPPPWSSASSTPKTRSSCSARRVYSDDEGDMDARRSWIGSIRNFVRHFGWTAKERMIKEQASYQASLLRGLELVTKSLREESKFVLRPQYYPKEEVLETYFQSKTQARQDREQEQRRQRDLGERVSKGFEPPALHPIELVTLDMLDFVTERYQELTMLQQQHLEPNSNCMKRVWPLLETLEVYQQGGLTKELHFPTMRSLHKVRPDLQPWSMTN
ncbi:hypothetical protein BGZ83_012020 [Gryganskiella cystojenkinii]|nr:hypothetical protein BGZ83_012020 [Gryganskiella cystojenkinii]